MAYREQASNKQCVGSLNFRFGKHLENQLVFKLNWVLNHFESLTKSVDIFPHYKNTYLHTQIDVYNVRRLVNYPQYHC